MTIMTRRNIFTCCALLVLAGAVLHKKREVAGLREQVSHLVVAGDLPPSAAAKSHRQRPRGATREEVDEESDLLSETSTFRPDGELSPEAIKLLGLSGDEVRSVAEAIGRFRTEAKLDLVRRLKPTGNRSGDGSFQQFYYARARRDRGQAYFDSLLLEFGVVLGQDRSRQLLKGLTRDDQAARMGKLDLELEVVRSTGGGVTVNHRFRSPRTGDVTEYGGSGLAEFEAKFGKLFDLPEAD